MQILANRLEEALKVFNASAELVFQGEDYEVWEIDQDNLDKLNSVDDAVWEAKTEAWFRSSTGCVLDGEPLYEFNVNGHKMRGWINTAEIKILNASDDSMSFGVSDFTEAEYFSFIDWLQTVWFVSVENNIAAFAVGLAKYNHMTLAEFMKTYQGEKIWE